MKVEVLKKWIKIFSEKVFENKEYLTYLDSLIGDSDHGNNLARGLKIYNEEILNNEYETPNDFFKDLAMLFLSKVGGASGAIYGTAFLKMSQISNQGSTLDELLRTGLKGIQDRGKADVGEKTLVDIWDAVIKLLEENGTYTKEDLDAIIDTTKQFKATKGRAAYVGERSMGQVDPGTYSSALLFASYLEV
ncbi:dihydroxyacetone kinase subunit DhaL [Tuanshanicoccus lijuaniae]|uniref:dihydroxyacetone kinase subunit DhaL n=1 Tax=Aerococcaceae bacterium zg-1292 TaxID=2774330 RepID=UPI001BD8676E|nr:dihydroxyacetone kinase subunit L [Aerococcaceae bacterium zg-BR22]MBS4455507.1 dihydroxyacetone kinase subunit L [Aerococcaceae bacterium zg-A91]MBS4457126.1 dihydroxyacetone kinase subunit L [Aerococcaceae bacterium zg-BR33]